MPLRLECPHCHAILRLHPPLPGAGRAVPCAACGRPVRAPSSLGTGEAIAEAEAPLGPVDVVPPTLDFGPPRPESPPTPRPAASPPAPRRRRWALALGALAIVGVLGAVGAVQVASADLPSIDDLRSYRPATVTTVLDRNGEVIGEIYEQRRYVLPLDRIPERVRQAFLAAEDASFYEHGGIDYLGIARAMGRNLLAGRVAQGGSTITQQVAKNMLLTRERKLWRKVQEALLAWRIEEAYGKEHILFLYLNEIFLGSQSYGVEAAARTFFGKSVDELSLGEAALLAGLPPRPSAWNPHADVDLALERQRYVLEQMVDNGFVTRAEADAARAERIRIAPRGNTSWGIAPHFVEHVRRILIDAYGEDRVLNEGLSVTTTCDLPLQRAAQRAVEEGVADLDRNLGFRREAVARVEPDAVDAKVAEIEAALAARRRDDGGSVLAVGDDVTGVVTEVRSGWARLRVGRHEALAPLAWHTWVYPPIEGRSWKYREQDDLGRRYDLDGDGAEDDPILQVGDVLDLRVASLSTRAAPEEAAEKGFARAFADTPGATADLVAVRIRQVPEVESALLSFELSDDPEAAGAVRAMVGGADFGRSQLNRAVQAYRQVGSTFKPIVYGAAIDTRKITTASIVPDAPLAYATDIGLWKPSNYGADFRGNITLRQALALSRNTSTIRVLDAVDPGMNADVVWSFARRLGIGGPPLHTLPDDYVPSPADDHLCPWLPYTPGKSCIDRQRGADGAEVCRACDLSMGLGSASLTMEELARGYGVIANGGRWVEPYYVIEVRDRDGQLAAPVEGSTFQPRHLPVEPVQVIDPAVATITTWLLENVATSGTGYRAHRDLDVHVAGKTGTTNDEKDVWFVGFTPDVVTAVWVGYDQPRSLGGGATGGEVALPIWIDFMREAVRGRLDRPFPSRGGVVSASIDEATGAVVRSGGRAYPFLAGTVPSGVPYEAGEARLEDLATEL